MISFSNLDFKEESAGRRTSGASYQVLQEDAGKYSVYFYCTDMFIIIIISTFFQVNRRILQIGHHFRGENIKYPYSSTDPY